MVYKLLVARVPEDFHKLVKATAAQRGESIHEAMVFGVCNRYELPFPEKVSESDDEEEEACQDPIRSPQS